MDRSNLPHDLLSILLLLLVAVGLLWLGGQILLRIGLFVVFSALRFIVSHGI